MRVLIPVGTRPEIIKLAPVAAALRERGCTVRVVATGQHFDRKLAGVFFEQLSLEPDVAWSLPDDPDERMGEMLTLASREIRSSAPDVVCVLGDTLTVPLLAFAARVNRVPLVHIEAGLRSFNETSIEETDRRVAAVTASMHFAPTELAATFLRHEGIDTERIRVVGNPVLDALRIMGCTRRTGPGRGAVITAHRATNVDDPERLAHIVELVRRLAERCAPVIFPVHPRTQARLGPRGMAGLEAMSGVVVTAPLPYDEMLAHVAGAEVVVTDSGGLQEEASWLGVPCVVLRESTPRWEGVLAETSALVGLDVERALAAVDRFREPDEAARISNAPCPYGDGFAAQRIADALTDPSSRPLLAFAEPEIGKPDARLVSAVASVR